MSLQTKDLIKILPFDEAFKKELGDSFDSLDTDKRNSIEKLLWGTYFALYDFKLNENLSIALAEAKKNREKLDENFYWRVKELTDREIEHVSAEDIKTADLEEARDKLAEIVSPDK
ncbi:MAG: hypothetical protein A3C30_03850 [Candidatus Levybacteria bacterium RIFCSPHIGHO2_02_FULL_40_18]|nr:MAG: hypothetical protein A2869_00470 [Candidatus Levybacteria bacterium RIFCSPHIGHO2_01_FULL_40_58]OGH26219.1 MAG: hypothetical protein A3C30_03850 [Candidatus Levybacteria bacterium RIFCSPHIGHO2_02_FULL_40_18]OGH31471.1 MAG: hypothetical protein A3E43_02890 [Candidatus Levybacteria bacterium RIFCSPHIGHO2_12_FULL_40_31]OGH40111.1 MAG: hypothetical protein A2894_04210 [Candidatus Levybacteria bacterium RIFCSPLOWO2_01_FULL_40_64]OGH49064.1 MAG: hypothetical protein A3I54_00635 [Candidatus Lev